MSVLSNISRKIFCLIAIFDFNQSLHAASAPTINEFETGREFFEILGEVPSISPYCLRTDNKEYNRDWHELIKLIQLDLNQENYLKSMVVKANDHFNTKRNVWADYKKVTLSIKNTNCKFKGRYRLTGDGVDHFGAAGQLRHSVKIKLRSDNIGGIVKFKLLVPETRGAEVEVLNTLLHRELGFLAPRTALVNVDFQGESVLALFQEDITKELVEENSVHDGLLFEGDESLGIAALFTVPRITNEKLLSGSVNKKIARSVYKDLNSVYLSTGILSKAMFPELLNYLYDPPLAIDTDKQLFANNISEFHLLNYALYSEHGLSQDDSRFVYDPISRVLRPIYYDGYSGLRDGSSLKKANFSFKEAERLKLIKQISKLDRKLFHSKAMKLGINQNFKEISKFLETTIINLKLIETSENYKTAIEAKTALSQEQIMSAFSSSLEPRLPQKLKKKLEALKFFWRTDEKTKMICSIQNLKSKCVEKELGIGWANFLRYRFDESIINGIYMPSFETTKNPLTDEDIYAELHRHYSDTFPSVKIDASNGIKPIIDEQSRTISFSGGTDSSLSGQIIVHGGKLENWKIVVRSELNLGYPKISGERKSNYGYTGCLTFNDMTLKDVEIYVESAKCEDGVHFVRVKGNLKNIEVLNSRSDGIDADFSNLHFKNVVISNASNDCLDFSAGFYTVENASLTRCGDKGVSLGEKGTLSLENVEVSMSLIGLVSKDSSQLNLGAASIYTTNICMMAYRKKREFAGGNISGSNIDCANADSYQQIGSTILLKAAK